MGSNISAGHRVTRIWRVPRKTFQANQSSDLSASDRFVIGMSKLDSCWVILRQDSIGECRVYVDGIHVKTFQGNDSIISSGFFAICDGMTGEVIIKKTSSWLTSTETFEYKLVVGKKELVEINSLEATRSAREPPFFHASVAGHKTSKSPQGEEYVTYEIKLLRPNNEESTTIFRRYRDFVMLDMCLRWAWTHQMHYTLEILPKVPPKRVKQPNERFNDEFILQRQKALDVYVNHVLRLPNVTENPDVLAFFGLVSPLDDIAFSDQDTPGKSQGDEIESSLVDSDITLEEFEAILLLEGEDKLDQICTGPMRMTQEYMSKLAAENPLESVLRGIFRVHNVSPLIRGFDRMRQNKTSLTEQDFQIWCENQVPSAIDILRETLRKRRPSTKLDNGRRFVLPSLDSTSRILDDSSVRFLAAAFSECISCPKWNRLFANFEDGHSFQSLCTALEGYDGPTLIVLEDSQGCRFGALASSRWREEIAFFSGPSGALFSLSPTFYAFRRMASLSTSGGRANNAKTNKANNVQYMNARSKTLPLGIGFGGELHSKHAGERAPHPRLWIDAEFDTCFATLGGNDLVYESGSLLGDDVTRETFQIVFIEAWGLGGGDALKGREQWRAQKDRIIQKQRKVDKAQFANNAFDREYLLNGTFNGNNREANNN